MDHEGSATAACCGIATAEVRDPPAPAVPAAPAIAGGVQGHGCQALGQAADGARSPAGGAGAATAGAAEDPARSPHPDA